MVVGLVLLTACGRVANVTTADISGPTRVDASTVEFDFSGDAAVVDGAPVPAALLVESIDALRLSPEIAERITGSRLVDQVGSDGASPATVSALLTTEIYLALVDAELARQGVDVTEADRAAAEAETRNDYGDELDSLPADYRDALIERNARLVALQIAIEGSAPTADELELYYQDHIDDFTETCLSVITVLDRPAADEAIAELSAGADFAAVAVAHSIDPLTAGDGGHIGCHRTGSLAPEIEAALARLEVSEVSTPVETGGTVQVLMVMERRTPALVAVEGEIMAELGPSPSQSFRTWITDKASSARIEVDPRFGAWNPEQGVVRAVTDPGGSLDFEEVPVLPRDETDESGAGGSSETSTATGDASDG